MKEKSTTYKIEDNFLPEEDFIQLWNLVRPTAKVAPSFWKYSSGTVDEATAESLPHIKSPSLFDKVTDIKPASPINSWVLDHVLLHGQIEVSIFLYLENCSIKLILLHSGELMLV